jgi:hypothetical protein
LWATGPLVGFFVDRYAILFWQWTPWYMSNSLFHRTVTEVMGKRTQDPSPGHRTHLLRMRLSKLSFSMPANRVALSHLIVSSKHDRVVQLEDANDYRDRRAARYIGTCGNGVPVYKAHGTYSQEKIWISNLCTQHLKTYGSLGLEHHAVVAFHLWQSNRLGYLTRAWFLHRVIYLETIAAVRYGFNAIVRHFSKFTAHHGDGGMIQMFLMRLTTSACTCSALYAWRSQSTVSCRRCAGQAGFGTSLLELHDFHKLPSVWVYRKKRATYSRSLTIRAARKDPNSLLGKRNLPAYCTKLLETWWAGNVLQYACACRRGRTSWCQPFLLGRRMVIPIRSVTAEEKLNTMLLKYVQDLMTRPDQEWNSGTRQVR